LNRIELRNFEMKVSQYMNEHPTVTATFKVKIEYNNSSKPTRPSMFTYTITFSDGIQMKREFRQ
jgi:hypothetical protein